MKPLVLLFLFGFISACHHKQNEKQINDSNVYSLAIDYCETNPIDSSFVYTGEEDNISFCF